MSDVANVTIYGGDLNTVRHWQLHYHGRFIADTSVPEIAAVFADIVKRLNDEHEIERIYFEQAKQLRGAIRVALDEWHKFTDRLDDAIAVHDVLDIAYRDSAGVIP